MTINPPIGILQQYVSITLALLLALTGCTDTETTHDPDAENASAPTLSSAAWAADHHMHVFTPELSDLITQLCVRLECAPGFPTNAKDASDALAALDAAGIRRGVLLSAAYLNGSPEAADLVADIPLAIRRDNTTTLEIAERSCGRLLPFIGIDPLDPSALDEIEHWHGDRRVQGIKLHMASSDVDMRDPAQLERLAEVFARANAADLPIVIHLRNRSPDFGRTDVDNFLDKILPHAAGVPVQIAHAAGGGGMDAPSEAALTAFADAFDEGRVRGELMFDLAMVPDILMYEPHVIVEEDRLESLRSLIGRIGMERFVLGSDWAGAPELAPYYSHVKERLALPEAQWRQLSQQAAPYLDKTDPVTTACPD